MDDLSGLLRSLGRDSNPRKRSAAALALGQHYSMEALGALIDAVRLDGNSYVRGAAAVSIGHFLASHELLEDDEAIERMLDALLTTVKDDNSVVSDRAVDALSTVPKARLRARALALLCDLDRSGVAKLVKRAFDALRAPDCCSAPRLSETRRLPSQARHSSAVLCRCDGCASTWLRCRQEWTPIDHDAPLQQCWHIRLTRSEAASL